MLYSIMLLILICTFDSCPLTHNFVFYTKRRKKCIYANKTLNDTNPHSHHESVIQKRREKCLTKLNFLNLKITCSLSVDRHLID